MTTNIFVATHKEYAMPQNGIYQPVWAGAAINKNYKGQFAGDNTGDNISEKNPGFNELTVVYWGWKNVTADYKGLVHYRRYIGSSVARGSTVYDKILDEKEIVSLLNDHDVIVPSPRKFYIMSLYKHYVNSYKPYKKELLEDMEQMRKAIKKVCPEYLPALENVYNSTKAHMLNMFIMKGVDYDKYCEWLFSVLFEIDKHVAKYRKDTSRLCGALSEFLLDVYIQTNHLKVVERPLVELEYVYLFKRIMNRLKKM